jgi:hypothetical protein
MLYTLSFQNVNDALIKGTFFQRKESKGRKERKEELLVICYSINALNLILSISHVLLRKTFALFATFAFFALKKYSFNLTHMHHR